MSGEHEVQPLLDTFPFSSQQSGAEAESVEEQRCAERALLYKLDRRMSILVLIYILNYMDRNNISAARLRGFEEDLGLKGTQFASLISVLYIGYIIMQIPSNMFLHYYQKPSKYLPWCMIIWGGLSFWTGFVTTYSGALIVRFCLGFVEAAFFPGALFLISKWYKPNELSQRTALLSCGILLSNAFGSLIASAILDVMENLYGFAAWRWLFFVEGSLTILVAIWSMKILPDFPESPANWLTPAEHALAVRRLLPYTSSQVCSSGKETDQWSGLFLAITDWKVWWLAFTLLAIVTCLSFGIYFPTIGATLGFNTTITLLLCVPPWLFGAAVAVVISRMSDLEAKRSKYIIMSLSVGIVGFSIAMTTMNTAVRYISMFGMAQMYTGFICFLAWASGSVAHPPAKRAVALALINCLSQLGNVVGSYVWPVSWGPSYNTSYLICATLSALSIVMCLIFRRHLAWLNYQADNQRSNEESGENTERHRYIL